MPATVAVRVLPELVVVVEVEVRLALAVTVAVVVGATTPHCFCKVARSGTAAAASTTAAAVGRTWLPLGRWARWKAKFVGVCIGHEAM